jgi:predicted Zn-dependent protease
VARTLFETIGYLVGQKAAQAKNAFDLMGGTEEESLRAEVRLGRDLAAAVLERTPLVVENESTRFVGQVGTWLSAHVKEKKFPFSFHVTAEREPNAFALPGGPVFLSWPLVALCQGERDEIAFMLGHEMAHIVRRHALDRMVKDTALSLLLKQYSGRQGASALLSQAGQKALGCAFSQADEFEADAFAAALAKTAGGDTKAGRHLLEKIARRTAGHELAFLGNYFATHPPLAERIARLQV